MASLGSLIWESGTFSTRTSPAPYMTVARIWTRSFQVSLKPLNFSAAILVIRNMLHPINGLAVELFLDGDVAHGRRRRSAVPVLLTWREPDDIAGPDLLDGTAFTLHPAETGHDEQGLAKRMRVPGRACARFKGDQGASDARRIGRAKQWVDPHGSRKPLRRALSGRLRTTSFDFHRESS